MNARNLTPKSFVLFLVITVAALAGCNQADKPVNEKTDIIQVTLNTASGTPFTTLIAGPEDASVGILIVHDWFGITPFTHDAVSRLAAAGYRVAAVDLYGGKSAEIHKDAFALLQTVVLDSARAIIRAGIKELKTPNRRIAMMGFSMGGEYVIDAGIENADDLSAVVVWYGGTEADSARLSNLNAPVLLIGGGKDSPETTYALANLMESMNKSVEVHIFPGLGHAYAQPLFAKGKNYDKAATLSSWRLTDDFLQRHLGAGQR